MPELVALVLEQADSVSLVASREVCTTWRYAAASPRKENDYSAQVAGKGWLDVLRWARANGCPWDRWACMRAARGGHLEVLQWARANGCPWDEWTCA